MERKWIARLWRRARHDEHQSHKLPENLIADVEALFEISHSGMLILVDGKILRSNAAFSELLGYRSDELETHPLHELVHPDQRERVAGLLAGGEMPLECIVTLCSRDGLGKRDVSLRICRVGTRRNSAVIASVEDVTDLRCSERALRDHARRLRVLSRQIIDVQEQERRHLARELHDEIGQQLTMVKMGLERARAALPEGQAASVIESSIGQVAELTRQVRSLSLDLRPSMLDDLGLNAALRWYAGRAASLANIALELNLPSDFPRMNSCTETAFFRVAQEAINNILKHAGARRLSVRLFSDSDRVCMEIMDDGRGFDADRLHDAAAEGEGAGVLGMHERAALIGATLDVESRSGQGCTIRLSAPKERAIQSENSG